MFAVNFIRLSSHRPADDYQIEPESHSKALKDLHKEVSMLRKENMSLSVDLGNERILVQRATVGKAEAELKAGKAEGATRDLVAKMAQARKEGIAKIKMVKKADKEKSKVIADLETQVSTLSEVLAKKESAVNTANDTIATQASEIVFLIAEIENLNKTLIETEEHLKASKAEVNSGDVFQTRGIRDWLPLLLSWRPKTRQE